MKVSLVILSKSFGGAERHTLDLAEELTFQGVAVQLIVRHPGWLNESIAKTLRESIRIDWIGPLFKRLSLQRALHSFNPDIIHSHLGWGSRLTGELRLDIPKVATLHGRFKAKNHMRQDALICVAPWQMSTIPSAYQGEVVVIPNFLRVRNATPEERARVRDAYNINDNTLVIGAVGRFAEEKGFDTLIHAFRSAAIPNSRLLLVGDGPEMPALRNLANEHVIFAGWQNDTSRYYAAFDIFVSTSRFEPFGLALLEAMQNALPIIATRAEGPSWLLGKDCGITVPIDDIEAIAEALKKLSSDPLMRNDLGRRALSRSRDFQPEYAIPKLIALYQRLCAV